MDPNSTQTIVQTQSDNFALYISIASLCVSLIALYLSYKKFQRDKPILAIIPYISNYSVQYEEFPKFNFLKINASFLVNNSGDIPTSILESRCLIELLPNASIIEAFFKKKSTLGHASPAALPSEIKANSTTTIELEYTLKFDNFDALDSCVRPTYPGLHLPTRDDVILHVYFVFLTTHNQTIEISSCVFRKDQPESKNPSNLNGGLLQSTVNRARNLELRVT